MSRQPPQEYREPLNPNYRGDPRNPGNYSANISESQNCATWWTYLPANCDYEMLMNSMHNIGRVRHANLNDPMEYRDDKTGQRNYFRAAKVEFFDRESVDRLLEARDRHEIRVGPHGMIPVIKLNRTRLAPHEPRPNIPGNGGRVSRVLLVIGPREVVDAGVIQSLWRRNNLDYVLDTNPNMQLSPGPLPETMVVRFSFVSHRYNAARALSILEQQRFNGNLTQEEIELWRKVTCAWDWDPCDLPQPLPGLDQ
ncbi:hypothetical protein F5Y16DRAFT_423902 [Xylariaceae sp. FL0255]|nr:hypothetical protein F5Y16DRAFT_423902 [Xylariaceae sp. FL0255]